jgi:hemerythrin-like domain-containing protein
VVHLLDVARAGSLPDASLLTDASARLRAVMEPHLRREELELFPLARRAFSEQDLVRMRGEMATRRKQRERGPGAGLATS